MFIFAVCLALVFLLRAMKIRLREQGGGRSWEDLGEENDYNPNILYDFLKCKPVTLNSGCETCMDLNRNENNTRSLEYTGNIGVTGEERGDEGRGREKNV